ncbi:hypothetical protein D9M70_593330 [compost metagenome]
MRDDALRQARLQGQLFGSRRLDDGRRLRRRGRLLQLRHGIDRIAPQRAFGPGSGADREGADKGEGKRTCRKRTSHAFSCLSFPQRISTRNSIFADIGY